ncbi:MAG: tRNA (adenosine(37)-N6)-threonylcarbamoyltransferase complex transferase subunit TsaD [Candidatus Colwellbacteria bacterium]|nr:tRNA (adenosine(37)-N6)-threonylcarbamoyltransferase complex transferase subunit TsaD [Candidatus Colwellbacteria bacterium]
MKILAIETSCDETAMALVEAKGGLRNPQFRVLKNIVSSQVKIHRPFGGVVPSLAKREHLKNLPLVLGQVLGKGQIAKHKIKEIDAIAVTVGPGLEPALWTGVNFAKELTADIRRLHAEKRRQLPRKSASGPRQSASLIGVNHLEGHVYSFLLSQKSSKKNVVSSKVYPAIALIVSGGHTILIQQKNLTSWKKLGETRDDAAGEAYDKVARLLGLPYPGGPELEKLALGGNPNAIEFPRPMIHQKNYDFSFSGLKTAVLYFLRQSASSQRKSAFKSDVAASFQQAILDVLTSKTMKAAAEYGVRSVILSGGVASNKALRRRLQSECRKNKLNFLSAERKYQTDNAAMIAVAAYINYLKDKKRRLVAQSNLSL